MKKIIFIFKVLAFLLLITLFSACKNNKESFEISDLQGEVEIYDKSSDKNVSDDKDFTNGELNDGKKALATAKNKAEIKIFVHVCGSVKNPDVYELNDGARAIDAIRLAGGFLKDAQKDYINLAAILKDQDKLYIPSKKEVKNIEFSDADNSSTGSKGKININTATKEELMTLSGIGASRADDIISYRKNNGSFKNIEDIMQVSGIKKAMFGKIKDEIAVN